MGKTIGSTPVSTFRPGALATAPEAEIPNESQSKSDPSPKVNFARLFCEMDNFRFGFEDDWEFDSGLDEGGGPEFTFGDGELGGSWRAGSGGGDVDVHEFVGSELDGIDGNGGEPSEEDGVRSGEEPDGGEFSEDGVRGGVDLDGGDDSGGAISGAVDLNSESVLRWV